MTPDLQNLFFSLHNTENYKFLCGKGYMALPPQFNLLFSHIFVLSVVADIYSRVFLQTWIVYRLLHLLSQFMTRLVVATDRVNLFPPESMLKWQYILLLLVKSGFG
jgi:hypothetical protein